MSDSQFSTLLRLITELSDKIDTKIDELRDEMHQGFLKHEKKCHEEHMLIMKTIETPFLDHEKRINKLENTVFQQ